VKPNIHSDWVWCVSYEYIVKYADDACTEAFVYPLQATSKHRPRGYPLVSADDIRILEVGQLHSLH
jgi:hypothetical protein